MDSEKTGFLGLSSAQVKAFAGLVVAFIVAVAVQVFGVDVPVLPGG